LNEETTNDAGLVHRACAGDEQALVQLLEQAAGSVRRSIQGKIDPRWQSVLSEDDVMQQTYADAFQAIKRFEGSADDFGRWLRTLAANNLRDAVRHLRAAKSGGQHRQVTHSHDQSSLQLWDQLADSISTPSLRARRGEANQLLTKAIRGLPDAYRQVVLQYDIEERSAQEVADFQGCSLGAMYMRRARAHDLLASILGSQSQIM